MASSPLLPFAETMPSARERLTPCGILIGLPPILDIKISLEYVAENFSANLRFTRFDVGHHPAWR